MENVLKLFRFRESELQKSPQKNRPIIRTACNFKFHTFKW